MVCHARKGPPPDGANTRPDRKAQSDGIDFSSWTRPGEPGQVRLDLSVADIHCAGCIKRIEDALHRHPAVTSARVNMSSRRVAVAWRTADAGADEIAGIVAALGYHVRPFDADRGRDEQDAARGRELLLALAVAGFAAGNVMLLSVSVWSGAQDATRILFHWLSALIAIPAIGYAGRPFFRSAWSALRVRSLNMDVPISLAVILATAMSLYETAHHGEQTYFDAAVMLLFFLLVGRYLDHLMRSRAHSALTHLLSLSAKSATVVSPEGARTTIAIQDIEPGMIVAVAAGDGIPVDGTIVEGVSDLDVSAMTGESAPATASPGDTVHEGTVNLTGALAVRVSASAEQTLLASIITMMEAAEHSKARYVRLADAAARIYAPLVHGIAALTFLGWMWASGGDWHFALFTAIAVLIITCPCALGLAVPVVQIVASGVLFRRGIMLKDGSALERLAQIDTVVFDKTGTLTLGRPKLVSPAIMEVEQLAIAAGLAVHSNHPLSKAITALAASRTVEPARVEDVIERPGLGLSGRYGAIAVRLGRAAWCEPDRPVNSDPDTAHQLELCLKIGDGRARTFRFEDELRDDAVTVVEQLKQNGFRVEILSGDRPEAVAHVAGELKVDDYRAQWTPAAKAAHVAGLNAGGRHTLVVGDGLNDAPALAAGHASIAPSSASDAGRIAADFVFLGDRLQPVVFAIDTARRARRLVMQNFALATLYNMIAVPLAILGYASPLIAAIAMSASSLVVTGNALRLRLDTAKNRHAERTIVPSADGTRPPDHIRRSVA